MQESSAPLGERLHRWLATQGFAAADVKAKEADARAMEADARAKEAVAKSEEFTTRMDAINKMLLLIRSEKKRTTKRFN